MKSTAALPDWSSIDTALLDMDGTLDWYCIDYWSRTLSLDIAAGRRVVLVTNAHPETLAIKDAHLGVRREFDAVYSSHELGEAKENAAFWPRLAAQEPFDVRRTLYVDDSLPVLRAARAHGIAWLYAVRGPDCGAPSRVVTDFPGVDSVHELAEGLAPRMPEAQPAGVG